MTARFLAVKNYTAANMPLFRNLERSLGLSVVLIISARHFLKKKSKEKKHNVLKLQTHPMYCKISKKSQNETKCDFSTP